MTEHCELTEKELASLTDAQVVLALKGKNPSMLVVKYAAPRND
jgi:hypothetical protein